MGIVINQSIRGTITNYIGTLIGFVTIMFQTKLLGAEIIGLSKILLEAGNLFSSFAQLGTTASTVRFFPYFKNEKNRNNGFFFYLMIVPFIGLLIFIPLLLLLKETVCEYFKSSPLFVEYYNWIIPLMCFLTYWGVFESYSSVLLRITIPKIIREIVFRLLIIIVYTLYAFDLIDLTGFVACYILVYGISASATFYYLSRIAPVSMKHDFSYVDKPLRKNFLSYTSILLIGSLGASVMGKIDIFMIGSDSGLASTGIYTIAAYMAAVVEIPSRSISAVTLPLASQAMMNGDTDKVNELYKKVSLHQFLIGSIIFILIWINIDNIYDIIPNGDDFRAGKWVVLFIGIGKLIEVTFNFGSNLISYSRYFHWALYFVLFMAVLTVFTNNWLIPIFGISGAAIATGISYLINFGLQQILIFTKLKGNPFSIGTVKQLFVILILFGLDFILPEVKNPWIDGIYRSSIIASTGILLIYFLKISKEINTITDHVLATCIGKKKN